MAATLLLERIITMKWNKKKKRLTSNSNRLAVSCIKAYPLSINVDFEKITNLQLRVSCIIKVINGLQSTIKTRAIN